MRQLTTREFTAPGARAQLGAVVATALTALLLVLVPSSSALDGCTPAAGDVSFRAADGIRLAGHLFGHGRVGVVLAHQSNGNVCEWTTYGPRLARLGFEPLALDFRNYGASQTASIAASARIGGDVAAAASYLRRHGAKKVFLLGASMGASAVIQAGANVRPPVEGVISVSPAELFADAIRSAARLRVPVLYVAGARDPGAPQQARHLFALTGAKDRALVVADDGRHGFVLIEGNARVRARIEAFLRSH
jgi:pimeloyl-ACP methyl ester carboxylesterase